MEELKEAIRPIENATPPQVLARGVLLDPAPSEPAVDTKPDPPASDASATDDGPGTVH